MPLTNTSRINNILVQTKGITSHSSIMFVLEDSDRIVLNLAETPYSEETEGNLAILKEIYSSIGFINNDGDEVIPRIINLSFGRQHISFETLQTRFGVTNPFALQGTEAKDGVTVNGNQRHVRLWQQKATEPSAPPAAWWGGDDASGLVPILNGWKRNRHDAVEDASTDPVWIAMATVTIAADPDNPPTYTSWEIHEEFGTEYSEDGINWHDTQTADDKYFGFLTSNGVRRQVQIGERFNSSEWGWDQIFTTTYAYRSDTTFKEISLDTLVDLRQYNRLRLSLRPFGGWGLGNNIPINFGPNQDCILFEPPGGWLTSLSSLADDNDDNLGYMTVYYDDFEGLTVVVHDDSTLDIIDTMPATISGASGKPLRRIAFKMKPIRNSGDDAGTVRKFRVYDYGSGANYKRFSLTLSGSSL